MLDGKNNLIDITEPLTGHTNAIDPHILWQSRITRTGIHSSETPPNGGGAANSTAITQQPPHHTSPTSPIQQSSMKTKDIDNSEEPLDP